MNIRFYNARILTETMDITEGELWVRGNTICYIGDGEDVSSVCKEPGDVILWDREIDVKRNLLMPGFKNAHTHSAMTFLRSMADDLPLQEWLNEQVFPNEAKLKGEEAYLFAKIAIMEYLTSGITSAVVCKKSGKLAVEGLCDCDPRGSMVETEYFATGTVPTEVCDHHVSATICTSSGMLANEYCPEETKQTGIYIVGGSEGTDDSPYLMTDELSNSTAYL